MASEIDLFLEYVKKDPDMFSGTPVTEQEISAFENKHNVKLPSDIKEYFLKINGTRYQGMGATKIKPLSGWLKLRSDDFYWEVYEERAKQLPGDLDKYFLFGQSPAAWV